MENCWAPFGSLISVKNVCFFWLLIFRISLSKGANIESNYIKKAERKLLILKSFQFTFEVLTQQK